MSTSTASTAAQRPVTAYLPQGRFGHAVVEHLAEPQDVVLSVDHGLVYASVPYADRLVMISDADRTPVREALDEVSFVRSLPSLGLELFPTELRCGPLVVPGRSACYRCYDRRRRQHGYRPLPPEVVSEHGPLEQAYAHHHVILGAGLISLALQTLDAPGPQDPAPEGADDVAPIGGRVWTIDLVSGITTCSPTVAVDRCETCSGRYEGRRDGLPALAALLPERHGEVA